MRKGEDEGVLAGGQMAQIELGERLANVAAHRELFTPAMTALISTLASLRYSSVHP